MIMRWCIFFISFPHSTSYCTSFFKFTGADSLIICKSQLIVAQNPRNFTSRTHIFFSFYNYNIANCNTILRSWSLRDLNYLYIPVACPDTGKIISLWYLIIGNKFSIAATTRGFYHKSDSRTLFLRRSRLVFGWRTKAPAVSAVSADSSRSAVTHLSQLTHSKWLMTPCYTY